MNRSRLNRFGRKASAGGLFVLVLQIEATAQGLYEFNRPEELTGNFTEAGASSLTNFTYSTLSGVGGIAGRVETIGTESLFHNSAFDFAPATTLEISTFFSYNDVLSPPGRENNSIISLGFSESPAHALLRGSFGSYLSVSLAIGPGGDTRKLGLQSAIAGVERATYSPSFTLSSGLYQLVGTWSLTNANVFQYTVSLVSRGSDGTGSPLQLAGFAGFLTNAPIAGDSAIFGGIHHGQDLGFIDNVSIIPEPAPVLLISLGFLSFALVVRRR